MPLSPDGKYLADQRASEKKAAVWLRHLEANTNVEIIPATAHIFGLAFANSGEYLYVVKGDPLTLYRVSLLGGVPTKIVDNPQGKFSISADDSVSGREFVRRRRLRNGFLNIAVRKLCI